MTIFGIIWIAITIFCFFKKDIKYMLGATLIGMLWQCNNILTTDTISFGSQIFTSFIFIIKSYTYKYENINNNIDAISNSFKKSWIIFLIYIIISVALRGTLTVSVIQYILMLFIYIFTFIRIIKISQYIDEKFFDTIIKIITTILLTIGFIQIGLSYMDINKNIFQTLFYNDINNKDILFYYNSNRFHSTFMEPSYIACLLVALLYYFINKKTNNSYEKYTYSILLILSIILTKSSTAYFILAIATIYYGITHIKNKKIFTLFIITIITMLLLETTIGLFSNLAFEKFNSGSGITRTGWNNRAFALFQTSPIFGLGYKSVRASSILYSILAQLGIIGIIIYASMYIPLIKLSLSKTNKKIISTTATMMLIAYISQLVACPDLDLCSVWLITYLFGLSTCLHTNKEVNNNDKKN